MALTLRHRIVRACTMVGKSIWEDVLYRWNLASISSVQVWSLSISCLIVAIKFLSDYCFRFLISLSSSIFRLIIVLNVSRYFATLDLLGRKLTSHFQKTTVWNCPGSRCNSIIPSHGMEMILGIGGWVPCSHLCRTRFLGTSVNICRFSRSTLD